MSWRWQAAVITLLPLLLVSCLQRTSPPTPTSARPQADSLEDFRDDCAPTLSASAPCPGNDIYRVAVDQQAATSGVEGRTFSFKFTTSSLDTGGQQAERSGCIGLDLDQDDATGFTGGELYGIDRLYCATFTSQSTVRYNYPPAGGDPEKIDQPSELAAFSGGRDVLFEIRDDELAFPFEVQGQVCITLDVYSCDQTGVLLVEPAAAGASN